MAGDAFQKLGDSMSRAITKISVKTSSSLEKSKIKMHIESLTNDVQRMIAGIGEDVYLLWSKGEPFEQALEVKLEAVRKKKSEIEQLSIELASIDDRDNEILGKKPERLYPKSLEEAEGLTGRLEKPEKADLEEPAVTMEAAVSEDKAKENEENSSAT